MLSFLSYSPQACAVSWPQSGGSLIVRVLCFLCSHAESANTEKDMESLSFLLLPSPLRSPFPSSSPPLPCLDGWLLDQLVCNPKRKQNKPSGFWNFIGIILFCSSLQHLPGKWQFFKLMTFQWLLAPGKSLSSQSSGSLTDLPDDRPMIKNIPKLIISPSFKKIRTASFY